MLKEDDMFKDFAARSPSASITDEDSNVWLWNLDQHVGPLVFFHFIFQIQHIQQARDCILFIVLASVPTEVEMEIGKCSYLEIATKNETLVKRV